MFIVVSTMTVFSDSCYTLQCHSSILEHIEAYSSVLERMHEYSECRRPSRAQCNIDQCRSGKQLATGMSAHDKLHEVEVRNASEPASPKLC